MRRSGRSRRQDSFETKIEISTEPSSPQTATRSLSGKRVGASRRLTRGDVDSFLEAAGSRKRDPQVFLVALEQVYPVRVAGIRSGLRWLRRQCLKAGIDFEDVRWLL